MILNRGAHPTPDDDLVIDLQDTFLHVQNWQTTCKEYGIKCHFFLRTTVPGHPGYGNFTKPVNNLTQMEEMVSKNICVHPKYRWTGIKRQNELALNELQKWSNRIDYQVIDAYHVNTLRPDEHAKPNID